MLTLGQAAKVDALKSASPDFAAMHRLAMRFRGAFQSNGIQRFGVWLDEAQQSGIYAMQRFVRTLRRDLNAATNALTEGWSNGQTEGQINRLKTLNRASTVAQAPNCNVASPLADSAWKVRQTPRQ